MKKLALALALLAPSVYADMYASNGKDTVHLKDRPCASELVLARLNPVLREEYMAASAVVDDVRYEACWRVVGNSAHLLYEDGDQGLIPLSELTEGKPGI